MYWYPIYAFVRRRGHAVEEAEDLTQEFFARLLRRKDLQTVDRRKGKFRSFLLASLQHFLANEAKREQAVKRGGGCTFTSWEREKAEERYRLDPADEATPEQGFERAWALTLLEKVMTELRRDSANSGKGETFERLHPFLSGDETAATYADVAAQMRVSESAVKMSALRLRRRYKELLRAEIAHTVSSRDEVSDEIRHLFAVLSA